MNNKIKETWRTQDNNHDFFTDDHVARFLRTDGCGVINYGRNKLAECIISEYGDEVDILDVACGTCINYEVLKYHGWNGTYCGLDRTQKFLDHAKNLYGADPNFSVKHGFAQETGLEDKSFTVSICRHYLEHSADGYESTIKELIRVTKKEIIVVFFLDPAREGEDIIDRRGPDEYGCYYYFNVYNIHKFLRFLAHQGIKNVHMSQVEMVGITHKDTIVRIFLEE